ncbi:MAG TPA: ABC transporter substrate-binding protein [Anaeromyxobacteraceae bacterium]|nr:ABC transporter substrate-binding protein [Anaeromyxobacteraceae bacterium]
MPPLAQSLRPQRALRAAAIAALLAAAAVACRATALELSPSEQAGKRIFLTGESPSGAEITVRIGREGSTLPGSAAPCGTCHGADGLGRPEGGVIPTEITWGALAKPYGHAHPGGRKHPAFDERSLGRTLRTGVDPAGNALDPIMPRYEISDADLASLVAYLKVVERDLDPGVEATALRVGVVLPDRGALAEVGAGMRKVLQARADALAAAGGVNGRKLELVFAGYDSDAGDGRAEAERLVRSGRVFALLSGFVPGSEPALEALAESEKVPLVGPFTLFARQAEPVNSWVFFLQAGVREQARLLAAHATRDLRVEPARIAILHPAEPRATDAAVAAREQLGKGGAAALVETWSGPLPDAALPARLARQGIQAVLFLGGDAELEAFARGADAAGFAPWLLASGTLAARSASRAPASVRGRVRLAYPSSPADETPEAAAELARLRSRLGLPERNRASQVAAVAAFEVLLEGLRRSGRHLSRERLVASLEALYDFPTGLLHPVTYGPNRRVGALGGWIVAVDPAGGSFSPVGGWRVLE